MLSVSSADVYGTVTLSELPIDRGRAAAAGDARTRRARSPPTTSALQAHLGYGLDVIRVRAFNHLGPGQTNHFVAPAIAERIARNELDGTEVVPVGNLTPRRDFTDVRDVVRAYRLLIEHGEAGEAYNVCSGVDLAISELADRLRVDGRATRCASRRTRPSSARSTMPVLRGDPTKLHKATGWEPEIPWSQTLSRPAGRVARRGSGPEPAPSRGRRASPTDAASRHRVALAPVAGLVGQEAERRPPPRRARRSAAAGVDRRARSSQVGVEQRELVLDLGVAGGHDRQPLGLGHRVGGARPPARAARP